MPTLELQNISYSYEKGKSILSNISAELETGKLYAVLGSSGSGKTTLLSLLWGLIHQPKAKSYLTARTLR